MKTVRFVRTTHQNGEFRKELPENLQFAGLGPHGFDPEKPKTFAEYLEFHIDYAALYDDFGVPPVRDLWNDVSLMLEHGFIKMTVDDVPNYEACLRAFMKGLEMQNSERILKEGEALDFLNLGRLMADKIKEASSMPAQLNRLLAERLLGDVKTEN